MSEETKIVDYRATEIGRQNWEVCARMLVHDLLDMRNIKEVDQLLKYYRIQFLPNGSYTMALPRMKLGCKSTKGTEKKKK